jgi:hypothetical protein
MVASDQQVWCPSLQQVASDSVFAMRHLPPRQECTSLDTSHPSFKRSTIGQMAVIISVGCGHDLERSKRASLEGRDGQPGQSLYSGKKFGLARWSPVLAERAPEMMRGHVRAVGLLCSPNARPEKGLVQARSWRPISPHPPKKRTSKLGGKVGRQPDGLLCSPNAHPA